MNYFKCVFLINPIETQRESNSRDSFPCKSVSKYLIHPLVVDCISPPWWIPPFSKVLGYYCLGVGVQKRDLVLRQAYKYTL